MNVEEFRDIRYEKESDTGIVTVTLNTPKRKNALSFYTFLELFWAVETMDQDDEARVMILTGARDPDGQDPQSEAFSSGGYFTLAPPGEGDPMSREEIRAQIDTTDIAQKKLTLRMWQLDKPVIAAINGLAIGGGFTLPLACADLIYVSEYAWARLPFVTLGILPEFASSFLLPRLLGFHRAKEIIYFGEKMSARELLELGLVNKVLPHHDLMPFAREMALRLIPPQGAGQAVRLAKRALHRPLIEEVTKALDLENRGLNEAVTTEDFLEAISARLQKRPPVFKGR
jgi:2-(1,2-epoxy-1,2-dihydrophenyl)acetyl-CoA isomerase